MRRHVCAGVRRRGRRPAVPLGAHEGPVLAGGGRSPAQAPWAQARPGGGAQEAQAAVHRAAKESGETRTFGSFGAGTGLLYSPCSRHFLPQISFLFPPLPRLSPLQPRSAGDADLVRKAQTEGIRFLSDGSAAAAAASAAAGASQGGDDSYGVQRLPPQVVEEALIIAEMFNLNEIVSLQLLLKGWFFLMNPCCPENVHPAFMRAIRNYSTALLSLHDIFSVIYSVRRGAVEPVPRPDARPRLRPALLRRPQVPGAVAPHPHPGEGGAHLDAGAPGGHLRGRVKLHGAARRGGNGREDSL